MAADAALQQGAANEGERCATRALELLRHIASSPERDQLELHLRLALCAALSMSSVGPRTMLDFVFHTSIVVAALLAGLVAVWRTRVTLPNLPD